MTLHREIHFEDEIRADLAAAGWLHADGDAASYDGAHALFPARVLARVQATEPAAWVALSESHGAAAEARLQDRLCKSLDDRGTLAVRRHGVELLGLRQPVALAQFKPADNLVAFSCNRKNSKGAGWIYRLKLNGQGTTTDDIFVVATAAGRNQRRT